MKRNLLLFFALIATAFTMSGQVTSVAIVGEAAGGWPGDPGNPGPVDVHQMTSTDNVHWTLTNLLLTPAQPLGGIKFRANNAWDINWGGPTFPNGTGTQNGPNIVCVGGTWDVNFNSDTGEYQFIGPPIPVVTLIGSAVTGSEIAFTTSDANLYTATNVALIDGSAQFTLDGAPYGGPDFPEGDATDPSASIPVPAGTYTSITYDISNGHYIFTAAPTFATIGIIGASVGGWDDGHEFIMHTTDGINYNYYGLAVVAATPADGLKFRTNHDWTQPNYGGTGWPGGTATTTDGNIYPTETGGFDVTFNLTTGEYSFSVPLISLTGIAFGGWGDGHDFDMTTADNGMTYTLQSITSVGGEGKFRSNHSWDSPNASYGGADFPAGVATWDNGANIPTTAGTYGVTFNHITGAYSFGPPLATKSFTNANGFRVYPNPSHNAWNFSAASNEKIAAVRIVDMLGKTVLSVNVDAASANVDASSLNTGVYFAKVATASGETTVKVVKN